MLPDRSELEQKLVRLQKGNVHSELKVRQTRPSDRDWAFTFANKPRLFLREIIGPEWDTDDWTGWRAFISAVFTEPFETAGEFWYFRHCTQLREQPKKRPPSVWLPIGRRGGKSRILAAIAVYVACCFDWTEHLDPGETGVVPVLAQDRRSARTIMGYIKAFLENRRLQSLVVSSQAESISLQGQILIEVVTASFRAIRNRTVVAALLDEVAFWRSDEDSANPDREIIAALEPAMATIPNALLLGASSPYARRGVLWDMYERYFGEPDGPLVWRAHTRLMNPTVPQAFIDEKYAEDPISAAAEYGAEFRSDVDAFVTREVLDGAVMRDVREIPYIFNTRYHAFVDPSGGSSDSMTLAIGHVDHNTKRGILDCLREVRPPFSPEAVVEQFARILKEYKIQKVRGDYYGGEWPKDRFMKCGIGYEVAEKRKSDIYLEFLPLLNASRVQLLDEPRMFNQFLALERRATRGGHEIIDHPKGVHDDVANVAAGVMVMLLGRRDVLKVDPWVLMRSAQIFRPHTSLLGTTPRWA